MLSGRNNEDVMSTLECKEMVEGYQNPGALKGKCVCTRGTASLSVCYMSVRICTLHHQSKAPGCHFSAP